jgi:hypothetical protein
MERLEARRKQGIQLFHMATIRRTFLFVIGIEKEDRQQVTAVSPRPIATTVEVLQSAPNPPATKRDSILKFSLMFTNQERQILGELQLKILRENFLERVE